jgi:hypothetical protein
MSDSKTLTKIIEILEPLNQVERSRTLAAALAFLGDSTSVSPIGGGATFPSASGTVSTTSPIIQRMQQYGLAEGHAERVFDFRDDGTFSVLDVAGKSKREQAINAYILTGLGVFLATGERSFPDTLARAICEAHGCLDAPNHAKTLGSKHPEFTGDKSSGWSITIPGIKRGVVLVKETAEAAMK